MKRNISIIIIIFILIGVCFYEEFFINDFIKNFEQKASNLSSIIDQNENNLSIEDVQKSFDELNNYWGKEKKILCCFVNYDKIKSVDESLVKLQSGVKHNDKALSQENISIIEKYSQFFHYITGFNLNNLF